MIYAQGTQAFDKSPFYDAFVTGNCKPSIFSTTDRAVHSRKRRLISHTFSAQSLEGFIDIIHDNILGFVRQIDIVCSKGETVDALVWLNYIAFDILSDLAFGKAIGMLERVRSFWKCELLICLKHF